MNWEEILIGALRADVASPDVKSLGSLCGYDPQSKPKILFPDFPPDRVHEPFITYGFAREPGVLPRTFCLDLAVWGTNLKPIHNRLHTLLTDEEGFSGPGWCLNGLHHDSFGPLRWDKVHRVFTQRARYLGVVQFSVDRVTTIA